MRTPFFHSGGEGKVELNRDIKRKDNQTWMDFLQNYTIFKSDQSNDMRHRNR